MSTDPFEIGRDGAVVRGEDPWIDRSGIVRAVVSTERDGELVHRAHVNLTSDRERSRYLKHVEEVAQLDLGGALLALEDQIRSARALLSAPDGGNEPGRALEMSDPEPWPETVDGAELLSEVVSVFERFLDLPPAAAEAISLWTVNAHAHELIEVSAILALVSPEKRCGKSTCLRVLGALVPKPLPTANVTAAALFRVIEAARPTLLIDEGDTFVRGNENLRGVLNSGHTRDGQIIRTVGDDHEPRTFSTWAPKAIALIGGLPDTLTDRSIKIPLRRRRPDAKVERLRLDRLRELEGVRRRACRWVRDNQAALRDADPDVPDELHDRAADNWRPLFAIADLSGGGWGIRARSAAVRLDGQGDDDTSTRTLLLHDLLHLFNSVRSDRLSSEEIVSALARMEDRPWPEWGKKETPLTKNGLARLLSPFGIRPKGIRMPDGTTPRGYERRGLEEAWSRYLPQGAAELQPLQHSSNGGGLSSDPDRNSENDVAVRTSGRTAGGTEVVAPVAVQDGESGDDERGLDWAERIL